MAEDQIYCVLDYETFSAADLKAVGAFEYSVHPSTEILCAAWRTGTRKELRTVPTRVWAPRILERDFALLEAALWCKDVQVVAHNAFFEQVITRNVLDPRYCFKIGDIPPERWVCTAAQAAALALPRSLEGAGSALNLITQKDTEGKKLMLKMCKPRKATKHNPKVRHDDPADLKRLIQYCATDIATEVELFLSTPMLTPNERKVWCLDQAINWRGFAVDRPLVKTTLKMIEDEVKQVNQDTHDLTLGAISSTTQRDQTLTWLNIVEETNMPDLRKATVEETLTKDITEDAFALLKQRQAIAKTSTAKYSAFEKRSRYDGRLRDILMYHGASTGRWSAKGAQIQNLPRPKLKQADIEIILNILSSNDYE